ncbi:MAG: hypothetical protein CFH30_00278 [Alphaproteobacteria bacterium MarineAlpha8_Bin1]|nr:MAG: hypothetical protein CFH30_00278 [Alphaproteobacteria bacterium MarineAlpha8_Bin1]
MQKNLFDKNYDFNLVNWQTEENSNIIILAIHGYNDYSKAFKEPAKIFSKHGISTYSFDLRGFGTNNSFGEWFELEIHCHDIKKIITDLKFRNPSKKIYLLGESMGGAISISLVNRIDELPLDGLILVAPAIWNFSESNYLKSIFLKFFSTIFPKLRVSGKGIIQIRPSNNIEMLKEYSNDPFVIHKPNLKSLNGIANLMDQSFHDAKEYILNPKFPTLIIIPMIDEIVPRKPLIEILKVKKEKEKINKLVNFKIYENNFHMILRDMDGNKITNDIKNWVKKENKTNDSKSISSVITTLEGSNYYHRLD